MVRALHHEPMVRPGSRPALIFVNHWVDGMALHSPPRYHCAGFEFILLLGVPAYPCKQQRLVYWSVDPGRLSLVASRRLAVSCARRFNLLGRLSSCAHLPVRFPLALRGEGWVCAFGCPLPCIWPVDLCVYLGGWLAGFCRWVQGVRCGCLVPNVKKPPTR